MPCICTTCRKTVHGQMMITPHTRWRHRNRDSRAEELQKLANGPASSAQHHPLPALAQTTVALHIPAVVGSSTKVQPLQDCSNRDLSRTCSGVPSTFSNDWDTPDIPEPKSFDEVDDTRSDVSASGYQLWTGTTPDTPEYELWGDEQLPGSDDFQQSSPDPVPDASPQHRNSTREPSDADEEPYLHDDDLQELVPAFRQIPPIRLLYLQVAVAQIIGSSTIAEATNQLQDGLDLIELCGVLPTSPAPRRSVATVKKHLGLQVDDFISKIPICDQCYKPYTRKDIDALESPQCKVPRCKGTVYRTKRQWSTNSRSDDVSLKRVPVKYLIYCSLVKAIQRFLLRPTFVAAMRDTSQDQDSRASLSADEKMHDIYDGSEWTRLEIGLKRIRLPDGTIQDVEEYPGSRRSLFSSDVGLALTINIDW